MSDLVQDLPRTVLPTLIPLVMIALVVRRSLRARQLRMDRMLLLPGVILLITVYMFAQDPPRQPLTIAVLAGAAALGALVGWHRGKLTRISHDPATGALTAQPSPAAVILILAVFVIRFAVKTWLEQSPGAHGHTAVLASNALLMSTVGLLLAQRAETYIRCRKLIAAAAPAA